LFISANYYFIFLTKGTFSKQTFFKQKKIWYTLGWSLKQDSFIKDHSEMYGLNVCEDVGCHSERNNEILLQTVMPFEIRKL